MRRRHDDRFNWAHILQGGEFCERLQDPGQRIWLNRPIQFHLDTARGTKRERADRLTTAIQQLSEFLDTCVAGGHSIRSRWQAGGAEFG